MDTIVSDRFLAPSLTHITIVYAVYVKTSEMSQAFF